MTSRIGLLPGIGVAALCGSPWPLVASAADAGPGFFPYVGAEAIYTDNFNRTTTNPENETLLIGQAGAQYLRESARASIAFDGALERVHYDRGLASDETRGQADLNMLFDLVPERAELLVLDRYGQIAPGSYGTLSPANRENVNYVAIGPRAGLPIAEASELQAAALVGRSDFQVSDLGGDRWAAQGAFATRLSSRQTLSLNLLHSDTRLRDVAGKPNLRSSSGFLRFDSRARLGSIGLEAGYARVDNSLGKDSGVMVSLALATRVGALTDLTLDASHGFRDTISSFLLSGNLAGLGEFSVDRNVLAVADFGRTSDVRFGVSQARERSSFTAGVSWSNERFVSQTALDRKVLGGDASFTHELGARTTLRITGAYYREQDASGNQTSRIVDGDLGLSYALTQRLGLAVDGQWIRVNGVGGNVTEKRGLLQLRYSLAPHAAAGATQVGPLRSRLPDDLLDMGLRRGPTDR